MAFTIQEYLDLVRLLAEHPEWRSELRRLLLSEELLELPQIVRNLAEAQRRTEERLERLEATVAELAEAQRRTEERLEALVEAQRRTEERLERLEVTVAELAEAQRRTEERLERLEVTTKTLVDKVGALTGRSLEVDYRDKADAYFGRLLRRLQVVALRTLEDILEAHLSSQEFDDLLSLDLLIKGRPRHYPDLPEVLLAVEISAVVDQGDLDRAWRRAALLRQAGYQVIPMVAGEQITLEAENKARLQKIPVLQDGNISFWEEALQTWITP
jgi:hypothetical protein